MFVCDTVNKRKGNTHTEDSYQTGYCVKNPPRKIASERKKTNLLGNFEKNVGHVFYRI